MARLLRPADRSRGSSVQSFAEEPLSPRGSLHDDHQGNRELRPRPGSLAHRAHAIASEGSTRIMLLRDNPVLTRELLVNLRSPRSFVLQFLYVAGAGGARLLLLAGGRGRAPAGQPGRGPPPLRHLLPGPVLPGLADGPDLRRGEHHRREGAEDLRDAPGQPAQAGDDPGRQAAQLALLPGDPDPLQPAADDPLLSAGGLLLSEITRSYLVLILAAGTFGLLSVACSSYFRRTSSALVVSYLVMLPLAVLCVALTRTDDVVTRDFVSIAVLPPWCLAIWTVLEILINRRLLHPPDVGSEGKDVVDEEEEMKYAIGVVIDRDLFPDKLFAPAKRDGPHARRHQSRSSTRSCAARSSARER